MDAEDLYLETIEDVERKIRERSAYGVIRGSALVRQLLLEGFADKVNRVHRVKLRFYVCRRPTFIPFDNVQFHELSTRTHKEYPGMMPPPLELSRDEFLAMDFCSVDQRRFSVLDVIKLSANVVGGVHHGETKTPEEKLLLQMDDSVRAHNFSGLLMAVCDVLEVTVDGLEPLTTAVRASRSAGAPAGQP